MKDLKAFFYTLTFLFFAYSASAQSGELLGKVLDDNGDPAVGVTVYLSGAGFQTGTFTDADGQYALKPIPAGTYSVQFSYPGFMTSKVEAIPIVADQSVVIDEALELLLGDEIVVSAPRRYQHPLMDQINPTVAPVIDKETLDHMPVANLVDALGTLPGVRVNADGSLQVRAARPGSTIYIVDGVKVKSLRGVPVNVVESTRVLNSFIPAKYGDTTGGVVLVETLSFSSY